MSDTNALDKIIELTNQGYEVTFGLSRYVSGGMQIKLAKDNRYASQLLDILDLSMIDFSRNEMVLNALKRAEREHLRHFGGGNE